MIQKPTKIHSRARARRAQEAKAKGRHTGYGTFRAYHAMVDVVSDEVQSVGIAGTVCAKVVCCRKAQGYP